MAIKVYLYLKSLRKASSATGLPKSSIHRWVQSSHNPLVLKHVRCAAVRKTTLAVIARICALLNEDGFRSPDDVRQLIAQQTKQQLSTSAVRFWMRKAGYTRKKPTRRVTRDGLEQEQADFCSNHMVYIDPERCVSLDETSFYFDMKPSFGYSHRSSRFRITSQTGGRARWSLIMAVTDERVVGWKLVKGSVNAAFFAEFIRELDTDGRDVLVMDNAAFHKTALVMQVFDDRNFTPLYLPPYTPVLQPIEHCFSVIKNAYRRAGWHCIPPSTELMSERVRAIIPRLTPPILANTFSACWQRAAHMLDLGFGHKDA
jgi:transposase